MIGHNFVIYFIINFLLLPYRMCINQQILFIFGICAYCRELEQNIIKKCKFVKLYTFGLVKLILTIASRRVGVVKGNKSPNGDGIPYPVINCARRGAILGDSPFSSFGSFQKRREVNRDQESSLLFPLVAGQEGKLCRKRRSDSFDFSFFCFRTLSASSSGGLTIHCFWGTIPSFFHYIQLEKKCLHHLLRQFCIGSPRQR